MRENDLEMAGKIAEKVRDAGGRVYFVGGYVRDLILGRSNKDIDIEVHGIPADTLEAILDTLGEKTAMGVSFGVLGLKHYGLDIAMPRRERATGRGHQDFKVDVDPFMRPENAAKRRDFTINALMQDVLTGEILDFFGGRRDLEKGVIRHVNDETFVEDPLRVLRAAQFAARFGFIVAEETVSLCAQMDLTTLSCERIMGELEKALLKAEKPSLFFEELRRMNQLSVWFPEAEALIGVEQPEKYHPEGDVWNHTMQVLDQAAALRSQSQTPLPFMLSALCHDMGKPQSTETTMDTVHAYGHEAVGVSIAEGFLKRLTTEKDILRYVPNMVRLHMRPNQMVRKGSAHKSFMHMFDEAIAPEDLLLLAKADHLGRAGRDTDMEKERADYRETEEKLRTLLQDYRDLMAAPQVRGQDLIDAGTRPGALMGEALAYAHKMHLAGVDKDSALRQTLSFIRQAERKNDHKQ